MEVERAISQSLDAIDGRFEMEPLPLAGVPVFVLASAWRAGSTLIQRLLVSSGELLMWGEPYDNSALIRRLAESLLPFDDAWPPLPYIVDPADPPTADKWIANAYPAPHDLIAAHRALFDRLFAEPAHEMGFKRWGVKGVRLSGQEALYLQRLYPDACFILLHRNPYDAFLSYRLLHDMRSRSYWWWYRWPDDQVSTAVRFGQIWQMLTSSFLEWGPRLGAVVVAYEDVARGRGLDRIEAAAGVSIDTAILDRRVGATRDQRGDWEAARTSLDSDEIDAIREAAGSVARRLGYVGPTPEASRS